VKKATSHFQKTLPLKLGHAFWDNSVLMRPRAGADNRQRGRHMAPNSPKLPRVRAIVRRTADARAEELRKTAFLHHRKLPDSTHHASKTIISRPLSLLQGELFCLATSRF
jgi:hypothetical protein